ncbi:hypothetical protein OS493_005909 [Desmophyllum pertusum]|uniref:Uncharacterized protein n=1 Tax=Desmophyllum pertusum TaxID=174260 RepID=A0A9W9YFI6_9CNID|nr:hypothetical protein OS493_005909 [Desmophyllum pertusum]
MVLSVEPERVKANCFTLFAASLNNITRVFYRNRNGHAVLWSQYMKARQQDTKTVFFKEVSETKKSSAALNVIKCDDVTLTQYCFSTATDESTVKRRNTENLQR